MEEEKAAAYYDELTRKGEGAARFKQGLGFSSSVSNDDVRKPGSALASSSSFLSKFVKASSPSSKPSESDKQAELQSIQNKLKKKPNSESRVSERSSSDRSRRRSRSRERYRESRRRSRSRDGGRHRHRDRRSDSDGERRRRGRDRGRRRSRSVSPRRSEKNRSDNREKVSEIKKGKNAEVDYARLIEGYDNMSSAERVKARMRLQLSETAAQDSEKGVGWERFEFNKDAPLDDEEIEVAEDDASLVKHIGQSFRFSAVEAKREEHIQAAHEEAMFGASALLPPISTDSEPEPEPEKENENEVDKKDLVTSLLSETVLAKCQGSWRDRVREA